MEITLDKKTEKGCKTLTMALVGQLILGEAVKEFQKVNRHAFEEKVRFIFLDMRKLEKIDAAGLGVLGELLAMASAQGITVFAVSPSPKVEEHLQTVGFYDFGLPVQ